MKKLKNILIKIFSSLPNTDAGAADDVMNLQVSNLAT